MIYEHCLPRTPGDWRQKAGLERKRKTQTATALARDADIFIGNLFLHKIYCLSNGGRQVEVRIVLMI